MSEDPTLLMWAKTYGFSLQELALIQPGYFGLDYFVNNFIVMKWLFMMFATYLAGFAMHVLYNFDADQVSALLSALVWFCVITIAS
jgi:hypothetical protein